jgi:hypothetical protein
MKFSENYTENGSFQKKKKKKGKKTNKWNKYGKVNYVLESPFYHTAHEYPMPYQADSICEKTATWPSITRTSARHETQLRGYCGTATHRTCLSWSPRMQVGVTCAVKSTDPDSGKDRPDPLRGLKLCKSVAHLQCSNLVLNKPEHSQLALSNWPFEEF